MPPVEGGNNACFRRFTFSTESCGHKDGHTLTGVFEPSSVRDPPHRDAHVGQPELGVEAPPVDGTHVLQPGEGGHGDGSAPGRDGQAVRESSVDPFLTGKTHTHG